MNAFLWFLVFIGIAWSIPVGAVTLLVFAGCAKVLTRRLRARLRPFRKADAPHDAIQLRADEDAMYTALTARWNMRDRTIPEPVYDYRGQP